MPLNIKINLPVLIIDTEGEIGLSLASVLTEITQVVLVTKKKVEKSKNLIVINFLAHIENIPDDKYEKIFFIINGKSEIDDYLLTFLNKSKEDDSEFIAVAKTDLWNLLQEHAQESFLKIILFEEIFGNFLIKSEINKIIQQARLKKIKLINTGLEGFRAIYFHDFIDLIFKVAFEKKEKFFLAFSKIETTALGVSHFLQKINPDIKVDFYKNTAENEPEKKQIFNDFNYFLENNYSLFEKIKIAYNAFDSVNFKENLLQKNSSGAFFIKKPGSKKIKRSFIYFLIMFCGIFIFLPLFFTIFGFFGAIFSEKIALDFFVKKDFKKAQFFVNTAYDAASFSKHSGAFLLDEFSALGFYKNFYFISDYTNLAEAIFKNTKSINSDNFKNKNYEKLLASLVSQYLFLEESSQKIQVFSYFPKSLSFKINAFYKNYSNILNVAIALPKILGVNKDKIYLVLFQNNAELRPGGGFISSYALVGFKRGMVFNFSIHDVYDADGLLKGHIEPPFFIRRYLPSVHLYLRDSNFDPDFTRDAYEAAFILKQETGVAVDGVFAVNETVIENLLKAIGPIYLPEENKTINSLNFFVTAERASEKNFFPGSRQKGNFLKSFFNELILKFEEKRNFQSIFFSILNDIENKNILLAFSDSNLEDLFRTNSLSSSLPDIKSGNNSSLNDFLGVSEANLGVNKANYFVSRSLSQEITFKNNASISAVTALNLKNNSSFWSGGDYKVFIRFILPNFASLNSVSINGIKQKITPAITNPLIYEKKGFIPPSGLEINAVTEGDKNLFGFLVIVPKGKTSQIQVSYFLNKRINLKSPKINYSLYVYKQPGVNSYPFSLKINFPKYYSVLYSPAGLVAKNNSDTYKANILKDENFSLSFKKD